MTPPVSTLCIGNTLLVVAYATHAYDLTKLRALCIAQARKAQA